ncbi:MAG: hypothetical protein LC624_12545, partial [Halobacteriales archaeon]|nr:hypothetical protein [Halobacteriales archaeon]
MRLLVALLALLTALPGAALASHFSSYAALPTEHDDMGSSGEPDFPGSTTVLGPAVAERDVDLDGDGVAEPFAAAQGQVLAPGCTDDAQRQPGGLCGMW